MELTKEQIRHNEIVTERGYSVVKSNKLIQDALRSKSELSLSAQKVLSYILSKIPPGTDANQDFVLCFSIQDFCEVAGLKMNGGGTKEHIKAALRELDSKHYWITEDDGEVDLQWIVAPKIMKAGKIRIRIIQETLKYIVQLKDHFTVYELNDILTLRNEYSLIVYEFLKSVQYEAKKNISLDEYRLLLGIEGKKSYQDFRNLRQRAIKKPVDEINEQTSLKVEYEFVKEGHTVVSVNFYVHQKNSKELLETLIRKRNELDGIEEGIPGQMTIHNYGL